MNKSALWRVLGFAVSALFLVCSGGGTETSNGRLTVSVVNDRVEVSGKSHLSVHLFDTGYIAFSAYGFSSVSQTDSLGQAQFDSLKTGQYNLYIWDNGEQHAAQLTSISIPSNSVHELTLGAPGTISGTVRDSTGRIPQPAYVYIPGSPFYSALDNTGGFAIDSLPEGLHSLVLMDLSGTNIPGQEDTGLVYSVEISPGEHFVLDSIIVKPAR